MTRLSFTNMAQSLAADHRDMVAIGCILMVLVGTIAWFSPHVAYDISPPLVPSILFVCLALVAGGALVLASGLIAQLQHQPIATIRWLVVFVLVSGLAMRLMQFSSVPIFEDDWNRYLWEGSVSAQSISPYDYAPADGFSHDILNQPLAPSPDQNINQLRRLSQTNDHAAYEVAYPYLTTIYPAGAQAAFRFAHNIAPFSLLAWRGVLLLSDLSAAGLILLLLTALGRTPLWLALYWWNPVVILPGFNGAHMDILLVGPLIAALFFTHHKKAGLAGTALGIAVSIKVWPIILAPLFVRSLVPGKITFAVIRSAIPICMRFSLPLLIISAISLTPLLLNAMGDNSGLGNYAQSWQKNSFLFSLINGGWSLLIEHPGMASRITVSMILIAMIALLLLQDQSATRLVQSVMIVIAGLVLLAPAGYPWYAIWFAALLPIVPSFGLLVLCSSFFLYYLRFAFDQADISLLFNTLIVPLEFGVPLVILCVSFYRIRSKYRR